MVFSGGFKIPEDQVKKKRSKSKKDEKSLEEVSERELEERKGQILNDLEISNHGEYRESGLSYAYFEDCDLKLNQ